MIIIKIMNPYMNFLLFILGNICENFEDSDLDSEENLIFDEYSDDEHGKSSHTTNGYSTSGNGFILRIMLYKCNIQLINFMYC